MNVNVIDLSEIIFESLFPSKEYKITINTCQLLVVIYTKKR